MFDVDILPPPESKMKHSWIFENVGWLASRTIFFLILCFVAIYLDYPLRRIVNGDFVQNMERAERRETRQECELLRKLEKQTDEMTVSSTTLLNHSNAVDPHKTNREIAHFKICANRFGELFASRKKVFADRDLEETLYKVREVSNRIVYALTVDGIAMNNRIFKAKVDLLIALRSKQRDLLTSYIKKVYRK